MFGFFREGLTYNNTGFSHTPHILICVNFGIKLKDKMFLTWYIVLTLILIINLWKPEIHADKLAI